MTKTDSIYLLLKNLYLRRYYSLQILLHFTIWYRRNLLPRNINQATDLGAANGIEQNRRRVSENNMPMICKRKLAILQNQSHKTRGNINLQKIEQITIFILWHKILISKASQLCRQVIWIVSSHSNPKRKINIYFEMPLHNWSLITIGLQRERRRFEKQPSQTMVSGAYAVFSLPSLDLYCTPLIVPFSSSSEVTVPCSSLTLQEIETEHTKISISIHQPITRNTELKYRWQISDERVHLTLHLNAKVNICRRVLEKYNVWLELLLGKGISLLPHSLNEAAIVKASPRYIRVKFFQWIREPSVLSILEKGIAIHSLCINLFNAVCSIKIYFP